MDKRFGKIADTTSGRAERVAGRRINFAPEL
jgi:hypothetical protein